MYPHSKPAVLLRELERKIDTSILQELQRELTLLDDTLDQAQEVVGARQQLQAVHTQRQGASLLARISEKPLSALTADEIALLKSVGSKPQPK